MPNNHLTEEERAERERQIRTRKASKLLLIQQWEEVQKAEIDRETDPTEQINARKEEIDREAGREQIRLELELKNKWLKHKEKLQEELKELDSKGAEKLATESQTILNEYKAKEDEEKSKYQHALEEIVAQYEEKKRRLEEEYARLEQEFLTKKKELSDRQEENKNKLADITNSIDQTIAAINMLSASTNGKSMDEASAVDEQVAQMKAALGNYNIAKSEIYKAQEEMNSSVDKLTFELAEKQKQKPDAMAELDAAKKKSEDEAWKSYKAQATKFENERQEALIAKQQELKAKRDAKAKEFEAAKPLTMDPQEFYRRNDTITGNAELKKFKAVQIITNNMAGLQKIKENELADQKRKLVNRVYASVEFDLEVDDLQKTPKSKPNTDEFNQMVSALQESVNALGTCDMSDNTKADIRRKCIDAYKACDRYLDAKDHQNFIIRLCRSQNGRNRIERAEAMKTKLKELYPELEQALAEEREQEAANANAQRDAQENRPSAGGRHSNASIQNELNAAKKEIRRSQKADANQAKDKNNNPEVVVNNTKKKNKKNVKGKAKA